MPSSMTHFRCARSQVPLTQQVLTCCELPQSSPSLTSRTRPTTSATAPWPSGPASTRCPDHTNATAERWSHDELVATRAQAEGNGGLYGAKYHDGSYPHRLLAAPSVTSPSNLPPPPSHRAGDYAFHSEHITTGSTGSHGTNHTAVQVVHATGSFSDPDPITGIMTPDPRSQNGWDAVVTRISVAGVFEGIFAVDTMPVDGKYNDDSLNSGWGGYSIFTVSRRHLTRLLFRR
eukprot:scaffold7910_cov51-Phaeocystis_antarctica.AAC.1